MKCYYIIKLPGGGEVKLLATVSTILAEGPTKQIYDSLKKEVENYYINKPEYINSKTPLHKAVSEIGVNLTFSEIKSVIEKSNASNFIDNLNKEIERADKNINFETALKKQVWKSDSKIPFINTKGKETTISLVEFLNKIQVPIHKKYFSGVSSEKLLNVKTLDKIKNDLDINADELNNLGLAQPAINSIRNILNKAFYSDNRQSDIFFEIDFNSDTNDAVVVKPENTTSPIIFYNGLNDLSLFVGVLKYMGSTLNREDVLPILEKYNNNVSEKKKISLEDFDVSNFFIGSFKSESESSTKFIDPDFNIVLANSEETLGSIINLITDKFTESKSSKDELIRDFRELFRHLNSENFGKYINKEVAIINQFSEQERKNKDISAQIKGEELQEYITKENIDYYYSRPIKKEQFDSVSDLYYYLNNNVVKNQDLVKVTIIDSKNPKKSFEQLIVPTEFTIISNGVKVTGFYEYNGEIRLEKRGFIFVTKDKTGSEKITGDISHRKLLSKESIVITENADVIPTKESITVIAPSDGYLPEDLVYSLTTRGSTIFVPKIVKKKKGETNEEFEKRKEDSENKNDSRIVKQVYPGVIKGNTYYDKKTKSFEERPVNTQKVKQITTHKSLFFDPFTESDLARKTEITSSMIPVNINSDTNFIPVSANDYIKSSYKNKKGQQTTVYNKVVGVDDDVVYILIKTEKYYTVKAIPKSSIITVYKQDVPFTIQSFENIAAFHNTIKSGGSISGFNFSSAETYEAAKDGDYLVYDDKTIYKLTNKEKREAIKLSLDGNSKLVKRYVQLPEFENITVVTNRKIDTPNGYHTALLNSIALFTEESDLQDNEEYREVKYYIPQQYKANQLTLLSSGHLIGGILEKNPAKKIPAGYIDVTEDLVKLINNARNKSGSKLLMKSKRDYYVRYNMSLHQSDFTKGIYDKFLDGNSYIEFVSTWDPAKSEGKIYKVLGVSEENGKSILNLEYSRFNDEGNLVSQHRQLDLSTDKNKIKWLYTMKGTNKNYQEIIDLDNDIAFKEKKKLENLDEKELIKQRKQTLINISKKFNSLFGIKVSIEDRSDSPRKKAWIETTTDGKPKIVLNLNNKNMSSIDLVHEYLHLFLMALKYNETKDSINNMYETFLKTYKDSFREITSTDEVLNKKIQTILNTQDWAKIEEYFVEDLSKEIGELNETSLPDIIDYDLFKSMFTGALEKLNIKGIDVNKETILSILNFKMVTLFGEEGKDELKKSGLILFESNFRDWLSDKVNKEKIIIEC